MNTIQLSTCTIDVDESTSLDAVKQACPLFFRTPFGKRETYEMYRGFLICRHTVTFSGRSPERRTSVYACAKENGKMDTFCVSAGCKLKSVAQAKRLVDTIIETKSHSYGMTP